MPVRSTTMAEYGATTTGRRKAKSRAAFREEVRSALNVTPADALHAKHEFLLEVSQKPSAILTTTPLDNYGTGVDMDEARTLRRGLQDRDADTACRVVNVYPALAVFSQLVLHAHYVQATRLAHVVLEQVRYKGYTAHVLAHLLLHLHDRPIDTYSRRFANLNCKLRRVASLSCSAPQEQEQESEKCADCCLLPLPLAAARTLQGALGESDWRSVKALFHEQAGELSREQLTDVMVIAAGKKDWDLFFSCLEKGAELFTKQPKVGGVTDASGSVHNEHDPDHAVRKNLGWSGGNSPLHVAVKTGAFNLAQLFRSHAAAVVSKDLVNSTDACGLPLLHSAVLHGDVPTRLENVAFLLEHGADVNARHCYGDPRLLDLVMEDHAENGGLQAAALMRANRVDKDADWTGRDDGWTALRLSCFLGRHELIPTLVTHGADPKELHQGFSLVDAVILHHRSLEEPERAQRTVETLLADYGLAGVHTHAAERRVEAARSPSLTTDGGESQNLLRSYPLVRAVFPVSSCPNSRRDSFRLARLLFDEGAVGRDEVKAVHRELAELGVDSDHLLLHFLRPPS